MSYPGIKALGGVDFTVNRGEVVALLGPNGSGKTTLLHVLAGLLQAEAGQLLIDDEDVKLSSPADAVALGIVLVTQEPELCEDLSILENASLGVDRGKWWRPIGASRLEVERQLRPLLCAFDADLDLGVGVATLPLSIRQLIVLSRALLSKPRLLLLDEPMTSMSEPEVAPLLSAIRRIANSGVGVILATHRIDVVRAAADRTLVLRDGLLVQEVRGPLATARIVGQAFAQSTGINDRVASQEEFGEVVLQIRGGSTDSLTGVDLNVRRGEVLGLHGAPLAETGELLRIIGGLGSMSTGELLVGGVVLQLTCPADALAAGIGYVTSDRRMEGLFPTLSIAENVAINIYSRLANRLGVLTPRALRVAAQPLAWRLRLVGPDLGEPASTLSGGNQQKVILSRVFATEPRVLLLDNATRGLDTEGRLDLAKQIRQFCQHGGACVITAAEGEFLSAIADRIVTLQRAS